MLRVTKLARLTVLAIATGIALMGQASAASVEHSKGTVSFDTIPKRVVVLGMGSLDILDRLGIQPVGAPHSLMPAYLEKYRASTTSTGNVSEPNFEAVYTLKPDVIIAEGRMLKVYDQLNRIAPTIMLHSQDGDFLADGQKNWRMLGKLFGKEAETEALIADLSANIEAIKQRVDKDDLNALMVMGNGGKVAMFDDKSRFSVVFNELGFDQAKTSKIKTGGSHGNLISFEYIAEANPDVMFILDRDQAIGRSTGKARAQFDNPLVNKTSAAKDKRIVFVDTNAWYIASQGITAAENIIADVAKALN